MKEIIEKANREALQRIFDADPVLVDVRPAGEVIPELGDRTLLHAGPPIGWERMCGPLRGTQISQEALQAFFEFCAGVHPNHRPLH